MYVRKILRQTRLPNRALADLANLSPGYLKQLSADTVPAGELARIKLAAGLRKHAQTLLDCADALERGKDDQEGPDNQEEPVGETQ